MNKTAAFFLSFASCSYDVRIKKKCTQSQLNRSLHVFKAIGANSFGLELKFFPHDVNENRRFLYYSGIMGEIAQQCMLIFSIFSYVIFKSGFLRRMYDLTYQYLLLIHILDIKRGPEMLCIVFWMTTGSFPITAQVTNTCHKSFIFQTYTSTFFISLWLQKL